jgi:hypothetical protein
MAGQLRRERLRREMTDEIIGTARLLLELGCDPEDLPADIGTLYAAAGLHGLTGPRE